MMRASGSRHPAAERRRSFKVANCPGRRHAGATRMEFLIRLTFVAVIAVVLLDRMLYYQEYAEKTVMEATMVNMRSGMRVRIAELMIAERNREIVDLLRQNPVTWLEKMPPDYVGEIDSAALAKPPRQGWFYDPGKRELVYIPGLSRYFESDREGRKLIRFRVIAKVLPRADDSSGPRYAEGLEIVSINQYRWF